MVRNFFKRNLWSLFSILVLYGLLVLVFIGMAQYRTLFEQYETELCYLDQATKSTTFHFFMQQEMLLDLLGSEVRRETNTTQRNRKLLAIFDHLTQINPLHRRFRVE